MRRITLVTLLTMGLVWITGPRPALAQAPKCNATAVKKLKRLNFDAMDENDRWELEKAKQKLEDAKLIAQSRGCLKHPELAKTYVLLGVVELRNRKMALMKTAWHKALSIDPRAQIPKRVRTSQILRLFARIKAGYKPSAARPAPRRPGARATEPRRPPPRPTGPPKGLEHFPPDKWEDGKRLKLTVRVAGNLGVQRVSLFYKSAARRRMMRAELIKRGADKWSWSITIPGTRVRGRQFSYFLVGYAAGDRAVIASGTSANMHIVTLTRAVLTEPERRAAPGPRRRRTNVEEENPLTGGALPRRARPIRRRVAARVEHPLENPDSPRVAARRTQPRTTLRRGHQPAKPSRPYVFAAIGAGTGIGLMQGYTEYTEKAVPSAPSLGSVYGQLEIGYLMTRSLSLNVFGRLGGLFVSDVVKEAKKNDMDAMILARIRYQSPLLLKANLPINLRWYAGGGAGYGVIRHLVKSTHPTEGKVTDTDRSMGFVPNVFGGVSMCVMRSCMVNIFVEANYFAAFTNDTDLNTYFHLDFTLGANFAF